MNTNYGFVELIQAPRVKLKLTLAISPGKSYCTQSSITPSDRIWCHGSQSLWFLPRWLVTWSLIRSVEQWAVWVGGYVMLIPGLSHQQMLHRYHANGYTLHQPMVTLLSVTLTSTSTDVF